ncbi:MAG: FkbM family methyltransferase [Syntrophorhabdales bacterium]|jgi:FkbM family methyltransferase
MLRQKALRRQYNLFKTFANWWLYYAEKFGLCRLPLVFVTSNGVSVRVPRQLYPEFKSIFLREHYLEGLCLPLPGRPVVVDIGANVGFFTLFAASKWGGRVFSYEPVRANFDEMVRNVERNSHITVKCVQAAVSGAPGSVEIAGHRDETFPTTARVSPPGGTTMSEKVRAVTLLQILEEEGLPWVDLLKMDCEGSEFSILYRSTPETLGRIGQMAIEVHPNRQDDESNAGALCAFLESAGFTVRTNDKGSYLWARNRRDRPSFAQGFSMK